MLSKVATSLEAVTKSYEEENSNIIVSEVVDSMIEDSEITLSDNVVEEDDSVFKVSDMIEVSIQEVSETVTVCSEVERV